jgi:transposase
MSRKQEQIKQPTENVFAGVDVSKDTLDLFVLPHGLIMTFANDAKGIRAIIRECQRYNVELVVLEATGKYHRNLHESLHGSGIKAAVVNPFRARQFADSMGKLAKTDTIDAEILARFAERMKPEPTNPPAQPCRMLQELQTARRQVLDEIGDLKRQCTLPSIPWPCGRSSLGLGWPKATSPCSKRKYSPSLTVTRT